MGMYAGCGGERRGGEGVDDKRIKRKRKKNKTIEKKEREKSRSAPSVLRIVCSCIKSSGTSLV